MPMPSRIAMHIAKNSARSWLTPARSSNKAENRAPTPVSEITPTMMPAQAQTAMIWMDITPASSNALRMERTPIGLLPSGDQPKVREKKGGSHDTIAAATVASVPARMTEYPMNSAAIRMMMGMN